MINSPDQSPDLNVDVSNPHILIGSVFQYHCLTSKHTNANKENIMKADMPIISHVILLEV